MRASNCGFELADLHSSVSIFACLNNSSHFHTPRSASFRRTCGVHRGVVSNSSSVPPARSAVRAPEIRKPVERLQHGSGSLSNCLKLVSNLRSEEGLCELDLFLELIPSRMRHELFRHKEIEDLIEIVMDLGRKPLARFPSGDWIISEEQVKRDDLQHAISKVGDFSDDNRSGIDRSLHRISAIRNRKMQIIGLTCRVGRAVSGSAEIIRDLVESGESILVIGPPGVGKTTLIREIARMLADKHKKRVVIVDTSNEIGGDGDVPHSGIGSARRMQVPNVNMQHNVMIEAVENHMPQTIVIDEIGTELEALAASTIAQRGVQLVGTAHGVTIESITKNPSLQLLVGGIESVTLGDEEARRRKVQKTILERKGPPAFACAVEMVSRTECRVHHRLDATVDAMLAGKSQLFEIRQMNLEPETIEKSIVLPQKNDKRKLEPAEETRTEVDQEQEDKEYTPHANKKIKSKVAKNKSRPVFVYTYKKVNISHPFGSLASLELRVSSATTSLSPGSGYGLSPSNPPQTLLIIYYEQILEADLLQVAEVMGVEGELDVTDDIGAADAILACSSEMKQNPWIRGVAKFHQVPVFVVKSNTMAQVVKAIRMILGMGSFGPKHKLASKDMLDIEIEGDAPLRKPSLEELDALEEVRLAIEYIVIPGGEPVELLPRRSDIIARQLELVHRYQLAAENSGTELSPRLQILPSRPNSPQRISFKCKGNIQQALDTDMLMDDGGIKGTTVSRLPFLPE